VGPLLCVVTQRVFVLLVLLVMMLVPAQVAFNVFSSNGTQNWANCW